MKNVANIHTSKRSRCPGTASLVVPAIPGVTKVAMVILANILATAVRDGTTRDEIMAILLAYAVGIDQTHLVKAVQRCYPRTYPEFRGACAGIVFFMLVCEPQLTLTEVSTFSPW